MADERKKGQRMTELTITCPKCKTDFPLTESLAAPLIEATRQQFEQKLSQKDEEIAQREQAVRDKEKLVTEEKRALEQQVADQVAQQLKTERARVVEEESRKAKLASAAELETKAQELSELQEVLKVRDEKLAEAQKAQAELIKKQRELDDAKRELELTVETRVQESLTEVRSQAKQEAEEGHKLKVMEKDQAIASMQQKIEELKQKDEQVAQREQVVRDQEKQVLEEKRAIAQQVTDQVSEQLNSERTRLIEDERKKAKLASAAELDTKNQELTELQEVLKARDKKLAEAQKAQAELLKKQRELDDAKRELELTVETRVQEGLSEVRSQAKREAEDGERLKVAERDQKISSMQRTIEELQRKAEQGSQQLQGEVQELELENLLRVKFPYDTIEPVAKGEFGGDALQRVVSPGGLMSGTILWESKRTKNWNHNWLVKLRDDQRNAKADISVLVSQVLPEGIETFDVIDGVWITHPRSLLPVATILRHTLLQVSNARLISEGQQTKAEMVYQYLTGPLFRQRVEALVEAFSSMQDDLDKERKVIMKQWAKRQQQIERVMSATVGMHGDLQGIAGKSIQEIEGLNLLALGASDSSTEQL
jgi:hypothetical protein